jgi:hypothetical protein
MSINIPDTWQVVKMQRGSETNYKVFAGWYGGYTGGDSWKLSSGIVSVKQYNDHYEFINHSGSMYVCYLVCNKLSRYQQEVLSRWQDDLDGSGATVDIVPVREVGVELV